jgi:hypothetical protein
MSSSFSGPKNKPSKKEHETDSKQSCSSETSVDFQRSTQHYILRDRTRHEHRCENVRSYLSSLLVQKTFALMESERRPMLLDAVMNQLNKIHPLTFYFCAIHFNFKFLYLTKCPQTVSLILHARLIFVKIEALHALPVSSSLIS